jgi:isopenicillin-N N-acyltransferase like protein
MPEVSPFPLLRVEGADYERGTSYGVAAAERIRRSIGIYMPGFEERGLSVPAVRKLSAEFAARIEGYAPEMLREMEGIAKGAALPVEDIVMLNARTEIVYGDAAKGGADDGCTGVIVEPSIAAEGKLIHAQNWDWRADCLDTTVVLNVRPEEGPDYLTMVEAGGLARCGFNSAGLTITGNFLRSEHDSGRDGLPLSLIRRKVLASESFAQAAAHVIETEVSFSNNIMLSMAEGYGVSFEKTPVGTFHQEGQDGLVVHSNHFLSAGALARILDCGLSTSPDSLYRRKRVADHLNELRGRITVQDVKSALGDRFAWPHSVCRPPTAGGVGGPLVSTVATVVMVPADGVMEICPAPYERSNFTRYVLE